MRSIRVSPECAIASSAELRVIRVLIPSPLFSYTGGQQQVEAEGETLERLLDALNSRFPGMRHRQLGRASRDPRSYSEPAVFVHRRAATGRSGRRNPRTFAGCAQFAFPRNAPSPARQSFA